MTKETHGYLWPPVQTYTCCLAAILFLSFSSFPPFVFSKKMNLRVGFFPLDLLAPADPDFFLFLPGPLTVGTIRSFFNPEFPIGVLPFFVPFSLLLDHPPPCRRFCPYVPFQQETCPCWACNLILNRPSLVFSICALPGVCRSAIPPSELLSSTIPLV